MQKHIGISSHTEEIPPRKESRIEFATGNPSPSVSNIYMSEDTEDPQPKKLKLSLKTPQSKAAPAPAPAPAPEATQPKRILKSSRPKETSASQSQPSTSSAPTLEQAPSATVPASPQPVTPKAVTPPPIKQPTPAAAPTPPPLPTNSNTGTDTDTPTSSSTPHHKASPLKLPTSAHASTPQTPPPPPVYVLEKIKSPILSIVIITTPLLIVAGSGYGIWHVLLRSDAPAESTTESAETSTALSNPIERAKKAIDAIPTDEIPTILEIEPEPATLPTAKETAKKAKETEAQVAALAQTTREEAATTATNALKAYQKEVTKYIQSLYIGAIRTGPRAKAMLNDQSYEIGDTVDPNTDLVFIGTRNNRLVFKDRNGKKYVKSF